MVAANNDRTVDFLSRGLLHPTAQSKTIRPTISFTFSATSSGIPADVASKVPIQTTLYSLSQML